MKKNIAIVAGGNSSEVHVSLRSAAGIKSFIDAEKYNCFIVTIVGQVWQVELSESEKYPIDRNDFSFTVGSKKTVFDFAYITFTALRAKTASCRDISSCSIYPTLPAMSWYRHLLSINSPATSTSKDSASAWQNLFCCARRAAYPTRK